MQHTQKTFIPHQNNKKAVEMLITDIHFNMNELFRNINRNVFNPIYIVII